METFHNAIEDFKLPCPYQKCLKTINWVIVRELGPWIRIFRMLRKTSCMSPFRRQEYYLVKGQNKVLHIKKRYPVWILCIINSKVFEKENQLYSDLKKYLKTIIFYAAEFWKCVFYDDHFQHVLFCIQHNGNIAYGSRQNK